MAQRVGDPSFVVATDPAIDDEVFVARLDGHAVGCGAMTRSAPATVDIDLLWVAPHVRGRGVGRVILERLRDDARRLGCRQLRIATNRALDDVIGRVRSFGFVEVPPFPAAGDPDHWFALDLD